MVSFSRLWLKTKRYSLEIVGGNWKWMCLVFYMKGSVLLLNVTLIYISCQVWNILTHPLAFLGLGNLFLPLIWLHCHHASNTIFESNVAKLQSRVDDMFNRSCAYKFNILYPIWTSLLQSWITLTKITKSFVSCQWCGKHYDPRSMDHFLSTSAHYAGRWSWNSLSTPWRLHASMGGSSHLMIGSHHFPLIGLFYECLTSNSLFTLVDCVVVPW